MPSQAVCVVLIGHSDEHNMYDIPFTAVVGPLGSVLIDTEMKQLLSLLSMAKPPVHSH